MSEITQLDINVDLGESFARWHLGHDEELFPLISSANLAAGFHAGDPVTLVESVGWAKRSGVAIGAHPGLPDLLGFGRRKMLIEPDDAYAYVAYQASAVSGLAASAGAPMTHIKLHGAFAASISGDRATSEAVVAAVKAVLPERPAMLYSLTDPSDPFPRIARESGVRIVGEIYPDLQYRNDGSLILERTKQLTDIDRAQRQIQSLLDNGAVETVDGGMLEIEAESICVHGDGPNAIEVVEAVRDVLDRNDVPLRSPFGPGGEGSA